MRLKKLRLRNINQHKALDLEFPLGITGIFGPNGSGKSNIMKGGYANLTNDFTRNPGTKAQHIRDNMPDDQQSFIEGTWEHGIEFRVLRSLSPEKNALWLPGREKPITNANEIAREIDGILGSSKHVLDNYVFIDQQQISSWITARPTERAEVFAHLCQTVVAQEIHKFLGDAITKDSSLVEPVAVDLDAARNELSDAKHQLIGLRNELLTNRAKLLKPKVYEKARVTVRKRETHQEHVEGLAEKKEDRAEAYRRLKSSRTDTEARETAYSDRAATVEGMRQAADAAKISLGLITELKQKHERQQTLLRDIERYKAQATKPPKPHPDLKDYDWHKEQVEKLTLVVAENKRFVAHFRNHETNCPTCEHELEDPKALLKRAKQRIADAGPQLAESSRIVREIDKYRMTCGEQANQEAQRKALLASKEADLAGIGDFEYSTDDESKFRAMIRNHKDAADELTVLETALNKSKNQQSLCRGVYTAAKQAHEKAKLQVTEGEVSEADYESAVGLMAQHTAAQSGADRAEGQVALSEKLVETKQKEYDRVKAVLDRGRAARKYLGILEEVRPMFHINMLPRVVHEGYMGEIVEQLNQNLEDFDSPFRISKHEGLTLYYKKRRTKEREAAWLSVGERVVLALAFRIAVSSIFAKDVGMLVLDEPTEGLDIQNMDCLETALLRLAQISKARGYQIIMITHETRLEKVFDHVIRIAA